MKVLFDSNVILDVILDREPFAAVAARLMARVEMGQLSGVVGATTVTTIHYLVSKAAGEDQARRAVDSLLTLLEVAPVGREVLELAARSPLGDFEDAVLHEAGRLAGCQVLVTRNLADFGRAEILVESPSALEAALSAAEGSG